MKFLALWTSFSTNSFMNGCIISGCENTLFELKEFGNNMLEYCFHQPDHPGIWEWNGTIQSTYDHYNEGYGCEYEGTWTFVAPLPGEPTC